MLLRGIVRKSKICLVILLGDWEDIYKTDGICWFGTQEDIRKMSRVFKKNGAKRVLDLGCGTGRHTIYLSKNGFDVYGFDMSKTGITYTKKRLKDQGLKAHVFVHDMSKRFPFPDKFFDAVISIQVIDHNTLARIRKTINEIHRILKNGGMAFITVQSRRALAGKKRAFISRYTYLPLDGGEKGLLHHYFTAKTLRDEFRRFKIKDVHVDSYGQLCIFAVRNDRSPK